MRLSSRFFLPFIYSKPSLIIPDFPVFDHPPLRKDDELSPEVCFIHQVFHYLFDIIWNGAYAFQVVAKHVVAKKIVIGYRPAENLLPVVEDVLRYESFKAGKVIKEEDGAVFVFIFEIMDAKVKRRDL